MIPGFLFINSVTDPEEWAAMWDSLKRSYRADDFAEHNDRACESWQYMGTAMGSESWVHSFRHRMHPRTQRREHHRVIATEKFQRAHPIALPIPRPYEHVVPAFDPEHSSGSFDGVTVSSDSDEGL